MNIKDRIKKISQYFKGMQVTNTEDGTQVVYVIVSFPNGWVIDDDLEKKYDITIAKNGNEYYFCADIEIGEEKIFDAIDYNIEKMKEAIERAQLLTKKVTELQTLFRNEEVSIEELRTLTFSYDKKKSDIINQVITSKGKKEEKNKEDKSTIDE